MKKQFLLFIIKLKKIFGKKNKKLRLFTEFYLTNLPMPYIGRSKNLESVIQSHRGCFHGIDFVNFIIPKNYNHALELLSQKGTHAVNCKFKDGSIIHLGRPTFNDVRNFAIPETFLVTGSPNPKTIWNILQYTYNVPSYFVRAKDVPEYLLDIEKYLIINNETPEAWKEALEKSLRLLCTIARRSCNKTLNDEVFF